MGDLEFLVPNGLLGGLSIHHPDIIETGQTIDAKNATVTQYDTLISREDSMNASASITEEGGTIEGFGSKCKALWQVLCLMQYAPSIAARLLMDEVMVFPTEDESHGLLCAYLCKASHKVSAASAEEDSFGRNILLPANPGALYLLVR